MASPLEMYSKFVLAVLGPMVVGQLLLQALDVSRNMCCNFTFKIGQLSDQTGICTINAKKCQMCSVLFWLHIIFMCITSLCM